MFARGGTTERFLQTEVEILLWNYFIISHEGNPDFFRPIISTNEKNKKIIKRGPSQKIDVWNYTKYLYHDK